MSFYTVTKVVKNGECDAIEICFEKVIFVAFNEVQTRLPVADCLCEKGTRVHVFMTLKCLCVVTVTNEVP